MELLNLWYKNRLEIGRWKVGRGRKMVLNPLEQFEIVEIKIGLSPMTNLSIFMIIPIIIFGLLVLGMVKGEVNRWVGSR